MSIPSPSSSGDYTGSDDDNTPIITTSYPVHWLPPLFPPVAPHLQSKFAAFEAELGALETQYLGHHGIVGRSMYTGTHRYSPNAMFMECMRSCSHALKGRLKTKATLEQEAATAGAQEKEQDRLNEEKRKATLWQWRSEGRCPEEGMSGYMNTGHHCIYHDGYGHFVETGVFEGESEEFRGASASAS